MNTGGVCPGKSRPARKWNGALVDAVEMAQIRSDPRLMAKLRAGHRDARRRKGRLVG